MFLDLQLVKIRNQAYLNAFGANLKRIRNLKKLTAEEVATYANIEKKQIYRIEAGEHSPTISTIVAIAVALGVHPKKLFDFEFEFEE
jgi:transcriptional regulator with XRE-family HTH domain